MGLRRPPPPRAAQFFSSSLSGARCQASPHTYHWLISKNLSFFEIFFKISPNIAVKGQPTRILRFFRRNFPRFFQAASHFLPPELKVRLRGAQSSAPMVKLSYHWAEQPIFCISPKAKLPNFRKESDNFYPT